MTVHTLRGLKIFLSARLVARGLLLTSSVPETHGEGVSGAVSTASAVTGVEPACTGLGGRSRSSPKRRALSGRSRPHGM